MLIRITYGYKLKNPGPWTYKSVISINDILNGSVIGEEVAQLIDAGAIKVTVKKEIIMED